MLPVAMSRGLGLGDRVIKFLADRAASESRSFRGHSLWRSPTCPSHLDAQYSIPFPLRNLKESQEGTVMTAGIFRRTRTPLSLVDSNQVDQAGVHSLREANASAKSSSGLSLERESFHGATRQGRPHVNALSRWRGGDPPFGVASRPKCRNSAQ